MVFLKKLERWPREKVKIQRGEKVKGQQKYNFDYIPYDVDNNAYSIIFWSSLFLSLLGKSEVKIKRPTPKNKFVWAKVILSKIKQTI